MFASSWSRLGRATWRYGVSESSSVLRLPQVITQLTPASPMKSPKDLRAVPPSFRLTKLFSSTRSLATNPTATVFLRQSKRTAREADPTIRSVITSMGTRNGSSAFSSSGGGGESFLLRVVREPEASSGAGAGAGVEAGAGAASCAAAAGSAELPAAGAGSAAAAARARATRAPLRITREPSARVAGVREAGAVALALVGLPERRGHVVDAGRVQGQRVADPGALEQRVGEGDVGRLPQLVAVVRLGGGGDPEGDGDREGGGRPGDHHLVGGAGEEREVPGQPQLVLRLREQR